MYQIGDGVIVSTYGEIVGLEKDQMMKKIVYKVRNSEGLLCFVTDCQMRLSGEKEDGYVASKD